MAYLQGPSLFLLRPLSLAALASSPKGGALGKWGKYPRYTEELLIIHKRALNAVRTSPEK